MDWTPPSPPPQRTSPPASTTPLQTYLEQNEGAGLQHLALKTNDIIATLSAMAAVSQRGGFEFMPRPSDGYYTRAAQKLVGLFGFLGGGRG